MKVAVFGGAFNPVHREHVHLARLAVKELKLDKIIIMPSAISPHKSGKLAVDFWHRYECCRLAFGDIPEAEVSNYELTKGGVSYTYLTCEHIARQYPDAERFLIIGGDMLASFPKWKNPDKILSLFTLAACAREERNSFSIAARKVEEQFNCKVSIIPFVGEKVSSTAVRTLAALDEDFSGYVPKKVCQYIKDNGLYIMNDVLPVREMLKRSRWEHTLRVAIMCAENASRVGLEERRAIVMAALHDCAKYLRLDSPYLQGFTCPEGTSEPVIHQYSGAYVAEHTFKIDDQLILDAIKYHTTGRENMTDAGILLYLCDMLEEGRKFDGVDFLRGLFKEDIKLCFKEALYHQVRYLQSTGAQMDGLTLSAYEWIKNR
ncbi:MAG: nicotinate (nicotinamide) nucleotide adenylyltransferase [Candidatus Coproplasma sp.]